MATVAIRGQLTLIELAKRTGNNNLLEIAEVLSAVNQMLDDAVWVEANSLTSHLVTIRTSLPTGTWRKLNYGVAAESSSTRQADEPIGMLESYSKIDADLVKIAPDPVKFRSDEEASFLEGMSQTLATALVYANIITDPERITGFAPRMPSLVTAGRVVGCGGTGSDVTSAYLVQWGSSRVHLIYPRGNRSMGINMDPLGEDTVSDGAGGEYQAFRTHFQVKVGLVVRDDRCIGRLANMEASGTTNIFDDSKLIAILNAMYMRGQGSVIYGNTTFLNQVDQQANSKTNVYYTPGEEFGKPVNYFRGTPIKQCDAIVNTETTIT